MAGQDRSSGSSEDAPQPVPNDRDRLIELIYSVLLEPHRYDQFMSAWERHLSSVGIRNAITPVGSAASSADPDPVIERHFQIAFGILEGLRRDQDARSLPMLLTSRRHLPCLLVDTEGRVRWTNATATRVLGRPRIDTVADLRLPQSSALALAAGLERLGEAPQNALLTAISIACEPAGTIFAAVTAVVEQSGTPMALIWQIDRLWRDQIGTLLTDAFGLSEAEVDIVRRMLSGSTLADIAAETTRSLNTVRTQFKTIQKKTAVKSQSELVRFVSGLMRAIDAPAAGDNREQPYSDKIIHRSPSGRQTPVRFIGPEDGRPVLFLHGMLDGCTVTEGIRGLLEQHRIRLIAPERPNFGSADPDAEAVEDAPARFSVVLGEILDRLRLRRTIVFGHMAGAVYAFAAHRDLGDRIAGILNVAGGVPIRSLKQLRVMSPRQRLVALTARLTPRLLPFIVRAGVRQIDMGGEENFLTALYADSPIDIETAKTTEVYKIITDGYHFTVRQGHRAFEIDSYHVVRDWSHLVVPCTVPAILVHGVHDPVVRIDSVRGFAERHPFIELREDAESGQLVFYRNPAFAFRALADLSARVL